MAKTEPVPCIVRDDDMVSAEEDSLAENVHREPLHPLDQFRAMQKLVEQGSDVETIAATFMVTPAVVKQRLKLADVSPKLHDGLDMVRAGWTATVANYFGRVTKPQILAAVEEACGADVAGRLGAMKKPEMASAAEKLLQGKGWLAKPLRTPEPAIAADQDPANDDEAADTDGHDGEAIDAVAAE